MICVFNIDTLDRLYLCRSFSLLRASQALENERLGTVAEASISYEYILIELPASGSCGILSTSLVWRRNDKRSPPIAVWDRRWQFFWDVVD